MDAGASSFPQGNPLPNAALATSHVDQLSPTPPHPVAESPPSDSTLPLPLATPPSPPSPAAGLLPTALVNPTEVVSTQDRTILRSDATNSNDLTPLARSVEDLSPALSAASTITTVATDEEADQAGDGRQSGPASENGVQLGHGSDEGGPTEVASPTKLVSGRRRSATGLDMPVLEESNNIVKESNGHAREESTLDSPIDPPDSRLPTQRAIATTSALPSTNGNVLPPLLANAPTIPDIAPPATTAHGSPKQKFTAAPPNSRLPDTPSSPPRPSTSRETATPIDPSDTPRRRPSTSTDVQRLSREKSTKDSDTRKVDREKEKEKDNTRSRKVLGEWTMSKTLGAGSMGKVKLGISSITGEKVAIKIIPRFTSTAAAYRPRQSSSKEPSTSAPAGEPSRSPRKESKEDREKAREKLPPSPSYLAKATAKDASKEVRTLREASLCLLLHHPYVCGMKSMFLYPNHYYMVFEYVNGGQMLDYIISHGRLRERSARKFARQIGSALQYCHANSIVHRDLKIENILISKTGNIKIIDFGLSNLYSPSTHLNTFCGSLYFAAPELLNAKPYTGPEVDVWSFGIVLYVLVCGKVPFDDQSMPALHAKIKRGQVEYPAWLSAECKHLLGRMLVTTPAQRATLTEVLAHPWIVKGFSAAPFDHVPLRTPLQVQEIDSEVIKGMLGFEFGTEEEIKSLLIDVLQSDLYLETVRSFEARKLAGESSNQSDDVLVDRPSTRVDGKDMKSGVGRSPTNKRFSGIGFYSKKFAGGLNAAFSTGSGSKSNDDSADESQQSSGSGAIKSVPRPEVLDPTRGFHPLISIYYLVREKLEREKVYGPGVFASSTLSLNGPPPPPAPAMAYQSGSGATPAVGEKQPLTTLAAAAAAAAAIANPTPPLPPPSNVVAPQQMLTPQPRQRATGADFPQHAATAPPATRADISKRSSFHPASTTAPVTPAPQSFRPSTFHESNSPSPRDRRSSVQVMPSSSEQPSNESDDVPLATQSSFARRFGSLLGRSSPSSDADVKRHRQRASIGGSAHKAGTKVAVSALPQVDESQPFPTGGSDDLIPFPANGKGVQRSSTVGELSPTRHQRGTSMGAGVAASSLSRAGGSVMLSRRPVSAMPDARSHTIDGAMDESMTEEEEDGAKGPNQQQELGFVGRTASSTGAASEQSKPIYLKGLFSVATTSTKSTATIRADLIRVLDRLGCQHRDVKAGFECFHAPSIDLASVQQTTRNGEATLTSSNETDSKFIKRRASRSLLNPLQKALPLAPAESPQSSFSPPVHDRNATTSSTSFTVSPLPHTSTDDTTTTSRPTGNEFNSSTAEGSTVTSDLIVRFEIFIVKMPFLPGIHGLQFRRIGGNAWQYQMLAKRILAELKL